MLGRQEGGGRNEPLLVGIVVHLNQLVLDALSPVNLPDATLAFVLDVVDHPTHRISCHFERVIRSQEVSE